MCCYSVHARKLQFERFFTRKQRYICKDSGMVKCIDLYKQYIYIIIVRGFHVNIFCIIFIFMQVNFARFWNTPFVQLFCLSFLSIKMLVFRNFPILFDPTPAKNVFFFKIRIIYRNIFLCTSKVLFFFKCYRNISMFVRTGVL